MTRFTKKIKKTHEEASTWQQLKQQNKQQQQQKQQKQQQSDNGEEAEGWNRKNMGANGKSNNEIIKIQRITPEGVKTLSKKAKEVEKRKLRRNKNKVIYI